MLELCLKERHNRCENTQEITTNIYGEISLGFKTKAKGSVMAALAAGVLNLLAVAAHAEPLLDVDLDGAAMMTRERSDPPATSVILHQEGHDITASVDPGTPYAVWRTAEPGRPGLSLAVRIDPEHRPPDVVQKSKFEINVVRQDDRALDQAHAGHYVLKNGSSNYLGFAIKLDRDFYDTPKQWLLHFQVWQCCSLKTLPPLVLQAVPSPTSSLNAIPFAMIARTDDYIADKPHSDFGQHLAFTDGASTLQLERDRWYSMVLYLKPDPGTRRNGTLQASSGAVDLWIDGHQALHYAGPWGYTPDAALGIEDTYAVKLGIYRAAQPTRQQIYLNSIRWGTDRASVDPDLHR